ncbi:MAG: fluoride efflux transporter CrcB [Magnetococcales bacterium]|nr:fluoride efflux transporter CrcB [Magnetococcales bacterium]
MKTILYVAAGGSIGAVLRYLVSGWVHQLMGHGFPWGTLVVNVVGSLLMGLGYFLLTERFMVSPELRMAILVGCLGAVTTFSTFSIETMNLIESGTNLLALLNILVSVVLCLSSVWLGMWLARMM